MGSDPISCDAGCQSGGPEVVLDELLATWTPTHRGAADARATQFRRELGLPTDRPIVMTGHQPTFWHPGILAKYLAAGAIAERTGAAPAWCVPDQDVVEPGRVRVPVRAGEHHSTAGSWAVEEHDLLAWPGDVSTVPAGARAAGSLTDRAPNGFEPVAERLRVHASEPNAARQAWRAHEDLLIGRLGLPEAPTVYATDLNRTALFVELAAQMRRDPAGCVRAYNAGVLAFPDAGMRELICDTRHGRIELPLWRLGRGAPREPVYSHELGDIDLAAVTPRALLLTGLLRLAGCDLFLHGTGGGAYDRVTEHWFKAWLEETLAPAGVVSATVRLNLGVPDVTRADLARAVWRAHHARHTPAMLGDEAAQREKEALVGQIRSAQRNERAALFARLHDLLAEVRRGHAPALDAFDQNVLGIGAALADRTIADDRTWSWMLHDDATLLRLCNEIRRRLLIGVGGCA
ncbi:MAG: hypothetical protein H6810_11270 [Phycisphaeraceae bacterium]|nr:MAG: hypothetical protein H6810_11270 [Phycisphaeraceae bacterium]